MAGSSRPGSILGLRRLFRTKHCRVAGDVIDVQPIGTPYHTGILRNTRKHIPPALGLSPLLLPVVYLCALWYPLTVFLTGIPIGNRDRNRDRGCLGWFESPFYGPTPAACRNRTGWVSHGVDLSNLRKMIRR